jgi:hypothetical protein
MAEFNSADEIIDFINFETLREQKMKLLSMIEDWESSPDKAKKETAKEVMGIVHLVDHIQDYAVDVLGKDEKEVFNLEEEKNEELIQMWLDAEEENRKHTPEGEAKCLELKDKFAKEFDELSDEDKKYVKGYLDDLGA